SGHSYSRVYTRTCRLSPSPPCGSPFRGMICTRRRGTCKETPMINTFKQALREKAALLGTILTTPAPQAAEVLAQSGFDWLFLDCEHGELEPPPVQQVPRAIGQRCHSLVRIPDSSPAWFKKALDSGADGIIIPLIKTPDQVRDAVRQSKYPPL